MREIGLMFYSENLTKDIEKMIARYVERIHDEPATIWYRAIGQPEMLAGLKTHYTNVPDNHYILAGKYATS